MPIHKPGERFRYNKVLKKRFEGKRSVTATLSLTAMVDMFTVLVIFLLQNYNTDVVIAVPKDVKLPDATQIKELKPAHVVTIGTDSLMVAEKPIMKMSRVRAQDDWMLRPLRTVLIRDIREKQREANKKLKRQVRQALGKKTEEIDWRKVTVQADKGVDILTVKKVMYTVTEAGASEINFAVIKKKN